MQATERPPSLYLWDRYDAYECMGCHEMIETPRFAVIKGGRERVPIRTNPENRLIWLELMELDHAKCGAFQFDAAKAKAAREYRRPLFQRPTAATRKPALLWPTTPAST